MLAALSLEKRPTEVPNLKSLRFFPSLLVHVKGLLPKCTVLKAHLLQAHQICCLQVCLCAHFSLEILWAGAVKGLIIRNYADYLMLDYTQSRLQVSWIWSTARKHTHTCCHKYCKTQWNLRWKLMFLVTGCKTCSVANWDGGWGV